MTRPLTTVVCPLCAAHCPLPEGITSPAFDDPTEPNISPTEVRRRQSILAAWSDPLQQMLAASCQAIGTGSHEGVTAEAPFWPYAP